MNEADDFMIGMVVNVKRLDGDQFNHDFTGTVIAFRRFGNERLVTVRDQDGDSWDCDPNQISYNSDI